MRFDTEALRDSCFYGRRKFFLCTCICMYCMYRISRLEKSCYETHTVYPDICECANAHNLR